MGRAPKMKAEERRKQIIEAATRMFSEKGFHLTPTKEIADSIGVSEPVIFKYFETKKELYLSVLRSSEAHVSQMFKDAVKGLDSAEAMILAFARAYYMDAMVYPERLRVGFQMYTHVGIKEVQDQARSFQLNLHRRIMSLIEKGVEEGAFRNDLSPNLMAWRFMSMGLTISMLRVLGLQEELSTRELTSWGWSFLEMLKMKPDPNV